jgi:hypothetical protein
MCSDHQLGVIQIFIARTCRGESVTAGAAAIHFLQSDSENPSEAFLTV